MNATHTPADDSVNAIARSLWLADTGGRTPAVFPGGRAARVVWEESDGDGLIVSEYDKQKYRRMARADVIADLLAALKYLVAESPEDMDENYNPHAAPLALARAALAKAEGR